MQAWAPQAFSAEPRPPLPASCRRRLNSRLIHFPAVCLAFGYLAEDLLSDECWEDVHYLELTINTKPA